MSSGADTQPIVRRRAASPALAHEHARDRAHPTRVADARAART